jgi:signal transduction histidine kinase
VRPEIKVLPTGRPEVSRHRNQSSSTLTRGFANGAGHHFSERKRLEQQLLEATRLDAIGRLAGGVAHDFNNLLVVILSSAHAILDAMPDDHPLREEAQQIADAGSGAALLTQQLLTYGRRGVVKPVPLDLNDTVATTSKLLGRLLGERIRIELRLASRIGSVLIDRGRMQQVVMNLAVNARDAMPGGGTVTIETARVELPGVHLGAPSRAFVVLRVKDTGCGMGPEVRAHLFQPFFTTKADGLGTGLGLATTHQIVSAAGGHIDVASEVGAGACFSVYLPCLAAEAHHVAPQRPPAPSLSGLEVLLVEDEAAVLRATARMLESAGCHVFATRDPLEALRLIQGQPDRVELLVTDLVMPGLSGKELANALHVVRPELPVVFISGHEHDLLGTEGQLDASVHLVEKPFEAASLIATVAAARDRP